MGIGKFHNCPLNCIVDLSNVAKSLFSSLVESVEGSAQLCGSLILTILFTRHSWGSEEPAQHSYLHLDFAPNVPDTGGEGEAVHAEGG